MGNNAKGLQSLWSQFSGDEDTVKRKENRITGGSICGASLRTLKAKFLFHTHQVTEDTRMKQVIKLWL
jgi:hypothetical protein